jgi:hypothetical protein
MTYEIWAHFNSYKLRSLRVRCINTTNTCKHIKKAPRNLGKSKYNAGPKFAGLFCGLEKRLW